MKNENARIVEIYDLFNPANTNRRDRKVFTSADMIDFQLILIDETEGDVIDMLDILEQTKIFVKTFR